MDQTPQDNRTELPPAALPGTVGDTAAYGSFQPQQTSDHAASEHQAPTREPHADAPGTKVTLQQPGPTVQNIYVTQQVTQQTQQTPGVVIALVPKSVFVSLLLTFFFGPLGMLYSTVMGGVIMLVVSIVVSLVTLGFGLIVTWPICMIWGAIAASNHNNRIASQSMTQISR